MNNYQKAIIRLLAQQAVRDHLTAKPQQTCGSQPYRSNRPVQIKPVKG
jgi:hypothetical protein